MGQSQVVGRGDGLGGFIERRLLEADRERLDMITVASHVVADRGRIQTSAQEESDRNVGEHAPADGCVEEFVESLDRRWTRDCHAIEGQGPVGGAGESGGGDRSDMTSPKLRHVAQDRPRPDHVVEGEVLLDRGCVDRPVEAGHLEECLEFGCDGPALRCPADIERLLARRDPWPRRVPSAPGPRWRGRTSRRVSGRAGRPIPRIRG